jgi:hypothetical protein
LVIFTIGLSFCFFVKEKMEAVLTLRVLSIDLTMNVVMCMSSQFLNVACYAIEPLPLGIVRAKWVLVNGILLYQAPFPYRQLDDVHVYVEAREISCFEGVPPGLEGWLFVEDN